MTTNFFNNIASLQTPGIWKLVINTDADGNMTVSELFSVHHFGDKAASLIVPLNLNGTADELDEHFFDLITQPLQTTAGLQSSMEAHLKSIEAAKAASKLEQDKKAKAKVAAVGAGKGADGELPDSKADKKKLYDEAMKSIAELNDAMKYEEAIALLPSEADYPDKENELKAKRADLLRKKDLKAQAMLAFND